MFEAIIYKDYTAYQKFETVWIFSLVILIAMTDSAYIVFSGYLKVVFQHCVKSGGHLLPVFKGKLRVCQPLAKFTVTYEVVPPLPALR